MLEVLSPVVQVVTAGPDWPAIAAGIAAGVVGLAGIGGTIWAGRISINADYQRARLADKRRIYAAYLAAIYDFYAVVRSGRDLTTEPGRSKLEKATKLIFDTECEVSLIAPKSIDQLAVGLAGILFNYADALKEQPNPPQPAGADPAREELVGRMRVDLGEPLQADA